MALWGFWKQGPRSEGVGRQYHALVASIASHEKTMQGLSESGFSEYTAKFKKRLSEGAALDDLLPEAFALVREVASRQLGQRHYDVQLMGGITLHHGKIAQMRTGEGKTLSATLPTYLNALEGKGAHVVTVNDYLARRDAVWMGQVYDALGLSVGVITSGGAFLYDPEFVVEENEEEVDSKRDEMGSFLIQEQYLRPASRQEAYGADITYGTNNEFGFDYLRDNLVQEAKDKTQRGFHYAIIDEVDSILIDEARTPLIISAPDATSSSLYTQFAQIVPQLTNEQDYTVDDKFRSVALTEQGIGKVEGILGVDNLYDVDGDGSIRHIHALEQSLKARALFEKDKDYVVRDRQVVIVDQFTGRMMPGRRFSEGLHQALEAKEGVAIQQESRTVATVTFQNYFRMYNKLSGMTGTATTNEEEFLQVYRLDIVVIPTHKPLVRVDYADAVFMTEEGKYEAVVREVTARHKKGQPVLIGTTSIERNEHLSTLLQKAGIKHEVLNAKNHQQEGEIIAQAGRKGAVTVATNMAGRGVDIILGGNPPDKKDAGVVRELGGLHIIGTERHEARRIDNQLRGRAARQGDPGSGQFFLSLEDKMVRVFGGDKVQTLMKTLRVPKDQPIESKMVSGAIENAQKKIEGMNFDTRKHLLEYDQVLNRQRGALYRTRDDVLEGSPEVIRDMSLEYSLQHMQNVVDTYTNTARRSDWDVDGLCREVRGIFSDDASVEARVRTLTDANISMEEIRSNIQESLEGVCKEKHTALFEKNDDEVFTNELKRMLLQTIDSLWMNHLETMEHTRDAVRLRAYGQRDPLAEYKGEGVRAFESLQSHMAKVVASTLFHTHSVQRVSARPVPRPVGVGAGASNTAQKKHSIGRNDPCPCGSGKKYKKCCNG